MSSRNLPVNANADAGIVHNRERKKWPSMLALSWRSVTRLNPRTRLLKPIKRRLGMLQNVKLLIYKINMHAWFAQRELIPTFDYITKKRRLLLIRLNGLILLNTSIIILVCVIIVVPVVVISFRHLVVNICN